MEKLASLFEVKWFNGLDQADQISYAYVAQALYNFLASGVDSHPHYSYNGFAPLLLRASFYLAGSFHKPSGTGGSNGGTLFHQAELDNENNGCIDIATNQMDSLLRGSSTVSLADATIIAGSVALDSMEFPQMDLLRITGGRKDVEGVTFWDRLASPDDDPMRHFMDFYGLDIPKLIALIGGAHNFGSAHGVCSGYVGQWTTTPLTWASPVTGEPEFFIDLMKDDWQWYEVCTFRNGTSLFKGIEDPFADGPPGAKEEHEEGEEDACAIQNNDTPFICEEQAMRGCILEDGIYGPTDFPCDLNTLNLRLRSDFFLRANPMMGPISAQFAKDSALLAEKFGIAYHKLTHNGLDRCGLSARLWM